MDATRFERMTKAAATGMSRRQVLRGLLAVTGGGVLVHLTGGESDARRRGCCRRTKRFVKRACSAATGGTCPTVVNFVCEKTGPGECDVLTYDCATNEGVICIE